MWKRYNPNPDGKNVGDCVIRAISAATGQKWDETFVAIALQGYIMHDMPSSNAVWGEYLRSKGFRRKLAPDNITVRKFAEMHPNGTYILALSGHVVCIQNGTLYDSWDSSHEIVLYYWQKG